MKGNKESVHNINCFKHRTYFKHCHYSALCFGVVKDSGTLVVQQMFFFHPCLRPQLYKEYNYWTGLSTTCHALALSTHRCMHENHTDYTFRCIFCVFQYYYYYFLSLLKQSSQSSDVFLCITLAVFRQPQAVLEALSDHLTSKCGHFQTHAFDL